MRVKVKNKNHPEGEGIWLELPVSEKQMLERAVGKLTQLAAGDEDSFQLIIADVESPVKGLKHHIMKDTGETSVAQMNWLARKVSVMTDTDLQKFSGAMEIESAIGIDELLWIADHLDGYELFSNITEERALGYYLVESGTVPIHVSARRYVDYSIIGGEYMAAHGCAHADGGLVVRKEDAWRYHSVIFDLKLSSDYLAAEGAPPLRLTLPAGEDHLNALVERLRVRSVTDCAIVESKCPIADLDRLINRDASIPLLNELAEEIVYLSRQDEQLMKLCAVLDAEGPETLEDALRITRDLDDYEQVQAKTPGEYAVQVLHHSGPGACNTVFEKEVRDFIDYEGYGRYRMQKDGVRETAFGMVRRISEPFPKQEDEETIKLEI